MARDKLLRTSKINSINVNLSIEGARALEDILRHKLVTSLTLGEQRRIQRRCFQIINKEYGLEEKGFYASLTFDGVLQEVIVHCKEGDVSEVKAYISRKYF
tara:strand:- start:30269 stop:30571 length:303 start_codon:yes stop_codon:yes gene_type:complete